MEYTLKKNDNATVDLNLSFSKEDIEMAFDKEYSKAQKKIKVNGFRPGKAPLDIVKKVLGDSISKDAINSLINESFFALAQDLNPYPINLPQFSIEKFERNEGMIVKAVYETLPIVELGEYKGIIWDNYNIEISEKDINEEIEFIQKRLATQKLLEPEEKTESGSLLNIGLRVFPIDVDIENTEFREKNEPQNLSIQIGEPTNLPGLDEHLIGLSIGNSTIFDFEYPEGFADESLVGQKVKMEITILEAYKIILPEINDELAKEWDESIQTLDELKEKLKNDIIHYYDTNINQKIFNKILVDIRNNSKCIIPQGLIYEEVSRTYTDILKKNNIKILPLEEFCKKYNYEKEKFESTLKLQSEIRLKNTYIIYEIANSENLLVSNEDLENYINALKETEEAKNHIRNNDSEKNIIQNKIVYDRVNKFIKDNAKKTDSKTLTKEQAIEFLSNKTAGENEE
ncbi:MAG: trigger factor [Leptospiraceae bacterium]|nr:trigger factor [Leptospiraceae bacterium]